MIVEEKYALKGISSYSTYPSLEMMDCKVEEYNEIKVGNQIFIPRYKQIDERKKDNKAISFFENGNIKSLALEEQTEVSTALGTFPAEFITFYEDGAIHSLFPRNGQLGFGWSVEDEEQLLEELQLDLPVGSFSAKLIGMRFYPGGSLKSIILWPGKSIELNTPIGACPVRIGFRLYEDGALESFEPAVPISVSTPIGTIIAFDQNAMGMDADFNSVRFYPDGSLKALSTNSDIVVNQAPTGQRTVIFQQLRLDMLTGEMVKMPVVLTFHDNQVSIDNAAEKQTVPMEASRFLFLHDGSYREKKCSPGSDCSGCGASCM